MTSPTEIFANVPTVCRDALIERWSALSEGLKLPDNAEFNTALPRVLTGSEFVLHFIERDPEGFAKLAQTDLKESLDRELIGKRLADAFDLNLEEAEAMAAIRRVRNLQMTRLAWRDIAGWADLAETLQGVSDLADACIQTAIDWAEAQVAKRFGLPRDAANKPQHIVVLAMGKLGGGELNFSSDVDLVLAWPAPGQTDGQRVIANSDFFTRVSQKFIALLDAVTADGFVFRVDTRLRPFGHSGPPAMHFAQMEDYFAQHGRDWERYAWIKARPAAGDIAAGEELLKRIQPFIYRRYLDFTAIDGLRRMKAMIEAELARKGMDRNIKLGRGGIREIEFVAQVFQLVRGGSEPGLRQRRLYRAFDALEKAEHLPRAAITELREAYAWLRTVENRLQQYRDQQTHQLPNTEQTELAERLAFALGYEAWSEVETETSRWRDRVHARFRDVFAGDEGQENDQNRQFQPLWEQSESETKTTERLVSAGFSNDVANVQSLAKTLGQLHQSTLYEHLDEGSRQQLDALIPCLLQASLSQDEPLVCAERMLSVLSGIGRRGTYFALLAEHEGARNRLATLCAASPWITRQIAAHPLLLDELLNDATLYDLPDRQSLESDLRNQLTDISADDLEWRMDLLRQFRNAEVLHIAAADVTARIPIMQVSDRLTELAEVLLKVVIDFAWEQLAKKHGEPMCKVDGQHRHAGFAIIAYGKAGGIELGYGSDLDLVFIHDSHGEKQQTDGDKPLDNNVFFARLVQRILHLVSATTAAGQMYEIDTRLRPSGKSGLLVSSVQAFANYQSEGAWTWEHQALIRSRIVADKYAEAADLPTAFTDIRRRTLGVTRDPAQLRAEVVEMRDKMRAHLMQDEPGLFDIKQGPGGITDIEFMVQYAVLHWASEHPALFEWTDNIRLLETLATEKLLPAKDCAALIEAYKACRIEAHKLALQEQSALIADSELKTHRSEVQRIWEAVMGV